VIDHPRSEGGYGRVTGALGNRNVWRRIREASECEDSRKYGRSSDGRV
jgi:hypothetical protein